MSNEYYQAGSTPAPNSPGASAVIRGQFAAIALAFDKMPTMAGSAGEFVIVNPSGTALIASGYLFSDFVTIAGVQTITNKTFAWADNTWSGFGTGATKDAGTLANQVLLLSEDNKLPPVDGSQITVLPDDASLGGAPTATSATVGDASTRIATTQFVADTVSAVGGAVPSNATPLMNGSPAPGANVLVSRDDHVHPVDTSRAPSSAGTAAGTSFTPAGTIIATNVQAAIAELDSEKAPSSAGTAAGTSFTPAGTIIATNVQAAIAELDSEKAPVASPTFSGTVTAPRNYNVTGPEGALQVAGVDAVKFDATGITEGAGRRLAQVVTYQTGAPASGTTLIPFDNTIPQQTEGDQYMSLSITPTDAASTLEVTMQGLIAGSIGTMLIVGALFRDSVADAVAVDHGQNYASAAPVKLWMRYEVVSGAVTPTVFKFRAGGNAGTCYFNSLSGGPVFGGLTNSFITIKEYLP